jgi:hypothetical protein
VTDGTLLVTIESGPGDCTVVVALDSRELLLAAVTVAVLG